MNRDHVPPPHTDRNIRTPSHIDQDLVPPPHMKRDLIILLPDPDGKIGRIHITTQQGSQVLDKAGYAVEIEDMQKLANIPRPIDEKEVKDLFGPALSAQPDLPHRFASYLLFFESNTTKLTHESKDLIAEILKMIKRDRPGEIYLIGHTDLVGTEEYNTVLSSRRANYVRDLLVLNGIKRDTLFVSFYGKARPLVPTKDEVPEPRNRRVEVIVR